MRTMYITDCAQGPALVEGNAPEPQPGPGELLIRVIAAGVTTTELLWYPSSHTASGEKRVKAVPGHEFSGIVAGIGEGVGGIQPGEEVFGMNDWYADGACAEYCIAPLSSTALKPPSLTHAEAASVPIGALTAWQGLFDRARLESGERVLVHGAAGAVGLFAVQLARSKGAHVIATASARNLDFVESLGAEQVIDYKKDAFEQNVRDLDVVFDTVGGDTLERSWQILKPNGRMVTVVSTAEKSTEERIKRAFFIVEPNREQLNGIGEMLVAGRLKTFVDAIVPLSQASQAYTGQITRSGRGKLVVAIAA